MSKNQDEKELLNPDAETEAGETDITETEKDSENTEKEQKQESDKKQDSEKKQESKKRKRTPQEEADRALKKVKRRKKLKYGALSITITAIFVAVVITVNVICNVLDKRYNWNIDLTSSGLYEMDQRTVDYLHKINSDVKITVLANESIFLEDNKLKVVGETLNRFRTESEGHISVEYVDTTKNPEAVTKYTENYSGQLSQGDVVVSCGDLVRVLSLTGDLVRVERSQYDYSYNYTFVGEQSLLSAIVGVTDLNPITIALVDSNNGDSIFHPNDLYNIVGLRDLLEKNNYTIDRLDLATDELSTEKYDYAILFAPYSDLTEAQVQKLTDFLSNDGKYGKNLIYFASPYQRSLPNLDEFLEVWGLQTERSVLVENNQNTAQMIPLLMEQSSDYQNSYYPATGVPLVTPEEHVLNQNFSGKLPVAAPFCLPVKTLFESNSGRTTEVLLKTADTCLTAPLTEGGAANETPASYNAAVLATTSFTENSETYTSQMIVFGSTFFLNAPITSNADTYGNADYFISMLNKLTGKDNTITIAEKNLNPTMITITEQQQKRLRNVTVIAFPLTVAIIGILVYLRRKNK